MMSIEQTVNRILAETRDPFLNSTVEELAIKTNFTQENTQLTLHLRAGFPTDTLKQTLIPALTQALQKALPDYSISIDLESFIQAHRTQLPGKGLRGAKNVIAVASGKGGVGKSTVAVNLATALAREGARVGLLDADIYGPSIPLMLGKTKPVEVEDEHYIPVVSHGVQAMSIGYLTEGEPALIWRGPMLAKSLIQMLDITKWDNLDYLFIDLPPGTGDIQLSLVQKIPLSGAVIVTTPQTVATLDAEKALKMFAKTNIDVIGIVENMSLHTCSQCHHQEAIFGEGGAFSLCKIWGCKLLGQLPIDSRITHDCEQGEPTALSGENLGKTFIKTALQTAIELSQKPLNYADKFPPVIVE